MSKTFDALKKLQQDGFFASSAANPTRPQRATPSEQKVNIRDAAQDPPSSAEPSSDLSSVGDGICEHQADDSTPVGTSDDGPLEFELLINDSPVMTPELGEQLAELAALANLPHETWDDHGSPDRSVDGNHARPSAPHYDPEEHELIPDEAWQELEALAAAKSLEAEFQAAGQAASTDVRSGSQAPTADESSDMTILLDDAALPSDVLREIPPGPPSPAVAHYDPVIPSVDDLIDDLTDDELATLPIIHAPIDDGDAEPPAPVAEPHEAPELELPWAEAGAPNGRPPSEAEETTVDWVPVSPPSSCEKLPNDDQSFSDATLELGAQLPGQSHAESAAIAVGAEPASNDLMSGRPPLAAETTADTAAHATGEIMQNSVLQQRISQLLSLPGDSSAAVQQCVQHIEKRFEQRLPHVLLMTAVIETTRTADVLFLLANALRDTGRKVLLVDANLSQQQMTRALEALGQPGLCDVLAGCREASEVAQPTGVEGVYFVPCGDDMIGVSRDVDLVPESVWVHAIHRWGAEFGYLLIDGGSNESTLLPTLARNCQAAVLLVPYSTRDASQLRSTARNLNSLAPLTVGCVLTDFPPTPA